MYYLLLKWTYSSPAYNGLLSLKSQTNDAINYEDKPVQRNHLIPSHSSLLSIDKWSTFLVHFTILRHLLLFIFRIPSWIIYLNLVSEFDYVFYLVLEGWFGCNLIYWELYMLWITYQLITAVCYMNISVDTAVHNHFHSFYY